MFDCFVGLVCLFVLIKNVFLDKEKKITEKTTEKKK